MNRRILKTISISLIHCVKIGDWDTVRVIFWKTFLKLQTILFLPLGLLFVIGIRIARPWLLIRMSILVSERLGHLAGNTELYLCERDAKINIPRGRYIDLWYHNWPRSNQQLAKMFGRVLNIFPAWLLAPANLINSLIPGGDIHKIGENSQRDRDIHNLFDRVPAHLRFLPEEEKQGAIGLRAMGVPPGHQFVCLFVRDGAYLKNTLPWKNWDYHDYRNNDIDNFTLAALELTKHNYYVIRMGAKVEKPLSISHPMIIDYAVDGYRSDFMDVYLGAKCAFCISTSSGFDAIPYIFRRPIVFVDHVPLGILTTFSSRFLAISKRHWLRKEKRLMTFKEIFTSGASHIFYASDFEASDIDLIPSSQEEIAEVVIEMVSRLNGSWRSKEEDEALQTRFWDNYPKNDTLNFMRSNDSSMCKPLHGEIRSRIGADFLRRYRELLE